MTEKHVKQIEAQLATGEKIERMYRAFEGDIRVITKDHGKETRYTVIHNPEDDIVTLRKM